ncbi:MAG TPA: globin family protein [Roseiflexaceae bacterium]|nr:globin family protein [Roseiflexaceae bacterium]
MTPEQIDLIEESFDEIYPRRYDEVASLFYERLFVLDPSLRRLFPKDMHDQRRKLMMTFNIAVHGLRHPPSIIGALHELGRVHVVARVEPHHYDTVGQALLDTLHRVMGDLFTPEVEAAWRAAYALIATTMLEGAGQATTQPV